MIKIRDLFYKYLEDLLIFIGLIFIVAATFMINKIAGLYVFGFITLALGIIFSRYPPRG